MKTPLLALSVVLLAGLASAEAPGWDGAAGAGLTELPLAQADAPATPASAPVEGTGRCVPKRQRANVRPAGAAIAPELVTSVDAFALTTEELAAAQNAIPALASPVGAKFAAIMRRAYVGGTATGAVDGSALRVITWNLNAPKTKKAVGAMLAAFSGDPEGVRAAMGHKKALGAKTSAAIDAIAANDVFLIQEVPLPTAIKLADAVGGQVYWAPEFIEVGDNAKDIDPSAGWAFTGNAIISRVPLSDFSLLRFGNQADWYYSQKGVQPLGDKLEKLAAKVLFAADYGSAHQTRPPLPYGGRAALFARAAAGDASTKVWVGDLHLEDLGGERIDGPQLRCVQMEEALAHVKTLAGPAVFGGDLNTMGASVGVGEGEDLATEGTNVMPSHLAQPPVDRQHGLAAGVGNKFFGVVDAGDLATTLTHDPGSRKKLVAEQTAALAVDIVPYAPTVHDGINAIKKIKKDPTPGKVVFYSAEVAADFMPYTAVAANGFKVYRDEKARHDPSSRFNADHNLFRSVKSETGAKPLNPRTGFRFGMGGYQSTWASGRPMGLVDTAVDWVFLVDDAHALTPTKSEVLKGAVNGTQTSSKPDGRITDHYPVRVQLALSDPQSAPE
ncbi:MAG TPA: hypothetical protein VN915_13220 [Elusimicrobiota bacterium]|nr:hypothetical protein [Elusimicrobiota bacterium]